MKDFRLLSEPGKGISVIDDRNNVLSIRNSVNQKCGGQKRKGQWPLVPLEKVGMDIACGDGSSIGGSKHAFLLVDCCASKSFISGMQGLSVTSVKPHGNSSLTLVVTQKPHNAALTQN